MPSCSPLPDSLLGSSGLSLSRGLQAVLPESVDAALVGGLRWMSPAWPLRGDAAVERTRDEVAAALTLYDAEGWLRDPSRFHVEPPALREVEIARSWRGPIAREVLRFESGYAPPAQDPGRALWHSYSANDEAQVWLLRHPGAKRRPWLVCVHGYGMGLPWTDLPVFRAHELHRSLGVNVACYVMPLHGPRARGASGASELVTQGASNAVHCIAPAVWDLRRLVGWIRGQGAPRC